MTEAQKTPLIYGKMIAVMRDVEAISKDKTAMGYKFRGIDDVYEAVHPVLAKHGVFTTSKILAERSEERQSTKGSTLIYRILHIEYKFWAEDGSFVATEVIGEGMDSGDKASNKGMSVGHKYAFLQALAIPTKEPKDPEEDTYEVRVKPAQNPNPQPPKYQPPDGNEIYTGTDQQRIFLKTVLSAKKVTEAEEMLAISNGAKTKRVIMKNIAQFVDDCIKEKEEGFKE